MGTRDSHMSLVVMLAWIHVNGKELKEIPTQLFGELFLLLFIPIIKHILPPQVCFCTSILCNNFRIRAYLDYSYNFT